MRTAAAVVCLALALGGSASAAERAETGGQCEDVSIPKGKIEARHGKWIKLTADQWEFLRGIYAMNPLTPPGLPYGDAAVLAKIDSREDALIFFIDGDKACTPMPIPRALLDMLDKVATSAISHEGSGL